MSEPNYVENAVDAPMRARTAAGEVFLPWLWERINAEKYMRNKAVASNPFAALRFAAVTPPSANGDHPNGSH